MKTEKELWEIVLSRPDLFDTGLCKWVWDVCEAGLITLEDETLLCFAIESDPRWDLFRFWIAEMSQIQPRIDWIKKRIESL